MLCLGVECPKCGTHNEISNCVLRGVQLDEVPVENGTKKGAIFMLDFRCEQCDTPHSVDFIMEDFKDFRIGMEEISENEQIYELY